MGELQVARDNHAFFYAALPRYIGKRGFMNVVCESLAAGRPFQYNMDDRNFTGYVLVNATDVMRNCASGDFMDALVSGLLGQVALKFPRGPLADPMNTEVTITHDIWRFSFKITKYERDGKHEYQHVEDPSPLPDGEKLGRFVELEISLIQA